MRRYSRPAHWRTRLPNAACNSVLDIAICRQKHSFCSHVRHRRQVAASIASPVMLTQGLLFDRLRHAERLVLLLDYDGTGCPSPTRLSTPPRTRPRSSSFPMISSMVNVTAAMGALNAAAMPAAAPTGMSFRCARRGPARVRLCARTTPSPGGSRCRAHSETRMRRTPAIPPPTVGTTTIDHGDGKKALSLRGRGTEHRARETPAQAHGGARKRAGVEAWLSRHRRKRAAFGSSLVSWGCVDLPETRTYAVVKIDILWNG